MQDLAFVRKLNRLRHCFTYAAGTGPRRTVADDFRQAVLQAALLPPGRNSRCFPPRRTSYWRSSALFDLQALTDDGADRVEVGVPAGEGKAGPDGDDRDEEIVAWHGQATSTKLPFQQGGSSPVVALERDMS